MAKRPRSHVLRKDWAARQPSRGSGPTLGFPQGESAAARGPDRPPCSLLPPATADSLRLLTWVVPRAGGRPKTSCQDTVSPRS